MINFLLIYVLGNIVFLSIYWWCLNRYDPVRVAGIATLLIGSALVIGGFADWFGLI